MNTERLLERIDDILEKISEVLNESSPQKDIQKEIFGLSKQIFIHLIKIILYGNENRTTLHHWAHELNNWLSQCMDEKIKKIGKDRYPNSQELYKWITKRYPDYDSINGIRRTLENEYTYQGYQLKDISDIELYDRVIAIIKESCPILASKENTDDKIEEIITRYILKAL